MNICNENGEFHTRLFDKQDNFGFEIVKMPFYCSNIPSKIFYGSIGQSLLKFLEQPVKLKMFLLLVNKRPNKENQVFLNENDPTGPGSP